jgi:hypothetical protein
MRARISKEQQRRRTLETAKRYGRVIPTRANMSGDRDEGDLTYYSKSMPSKVADARWFQSIGEYEFECELLLIRDGDVIARIEPNGGASTYFVYTATVRDGGFTKTHRLKEAMGWVYQQLGVGIELPNSSGDNMVWAAE